MERLTLNYQSYFLLLNPDILTVILESITGQL